MKPLELIIIFDLKYTVKKWCSMCIEESIYFEKDWSSIFLQNLLQQSLFTALKDNF